MINFHNASFVKSITALKDAPIPRLKELLVVGRSNVGKSSLINALTNHNRLAYTSSKPGHTRLLNYFNIDNQFFLVDAPGYGYAKGGIDLDALFGEIMEEYFHDNDYLKGALLLLDSRRKLTENDYEMINLFNEKNIPFLIVLTKKDKLNQKEKSLIISHMKENNIQEYIFTSSLDKDSMTKLEEEIIKLLEL